MRTFTKIIRGAIGLACALGFTVSSSWAQVPVYVDPSQAWIGYMSVSDLPSDGGAYEFGSAWGTADLPATFNAPANTSLTLSPNVNTYNATDTYWVKPDGSGNKICAASFYVQDDTLAGNTVNFSGTVTSYSLVSPYTSIAFIKEFTSSYALINSQTYDLSAGGNFSINLATTAGDHIQYGFQTTGPDANPATVASLGSVVIQAVPEPASLALLALGLPLFFIRRRK